MVTARVALPASFRRPELEPQRSSLLPETVGGLKACTYTRTQRR